MHITLRQFETIDGLYQAFLRRGELNHTAMTRDAIKGWMSKEWALFDACVDAIGYQAASAYPSAEDCAADLVTRALTTIDFVQEA